MFFWSEDEARSYRRLRPQVDGVYLTMPQASYATRVGQASHFDIDLQTRKPRR